MNATELAAVLSVTRARISQYVSEGKLAGCYTGEGRARRFDLAKVGVALGRNLDQGQMMGNGADTRRALSAIRADMPTPAAPPAREAEDPRPRRERGELSSNDPDRYELARTQKVEEEARRLRKQNAHEEGIFVLASEVERQVAATLAQEIAEVETVLREGARRIADRMGVDYKTARQHLVDTWRAHRAGRTEALTATAATATPTDAEISADI